MQEKYFKSDAKSSIVDSLKIKNEILQSVNSIHTFILNKDSGKAIAEFLSSNKQFSSDSNFAEGSQLNGDIKLIAEKYTGMRIKKYYHIV